MQPDFMYAAVASGEVDVIAGYTSDGLIAKYDLTVLDDPKHAIPPYDAIVLLAPRRANDEKLRAALQPLLGKIDIATMREANLRASGNDAVEFAGSGRALAVGQDCAAVRWLGRRQRPVIVLSSLARASVMLRRHSAASIRDIDPSPSA